MSRLLDAVSRWTGWVAGGIAALLTLAMTAVVFESVALRYLFRRPHQWSFELSVYLFIYAAALGMVYATLNDRHLRITMVYGRLPWQAQRVVETIILLSGLLLVVVGGWYGAGTTLDAYRAGEVRQQTAWLMPEWIILLVAPVALFAMAVIFLSKLCLLWLSSGGKDSASNR